MAESASEPRRNREPPRAIGRYELHERIASGGMAAVYFGRLIGPVGFSRTVAIKRLHPQFAQDPEFVAMFLDEARLAGRIRHPNVVPTLDVVAMHDELFLVMEYVQGESLGRLVRGAKAMGSLAPLPVVLAIFLNVLEGLHAAHEVTDDAGRPLEIVHRDVSPQNILVGVDGVSRVLDFGVAKAGGRVHHTKSGMTKGKIAYMAPEQVLGVREVTRAADIYATSICLWEALTGSRLHNADSEAAILHRVLHETPSSPRDIVPEIPEVIAQIVLRGLAQDPKDRFPTAHAMARALASAGNAAPAMEVAEWVRSQAGDALSKRAAVMAGIENDSNRGSAAALAFVEHLKVDPTVTVVLDDASEDRSSETYGSASAVVAAEERSRTQAAPIIPRERGRAALIALAAVLASLLAVVSWLLLARASPSPAVAETPRPDPAQPRAPPPPPEAPSAIPAPPAASAAEAPIAPVASASAQPPHPQKPPTARPPRGPSTPKTTDGLFDRN